MFHSLLSGWDSLPSLSSGLFNKGLKAFIYAATMISGKQEMSVALITHLGARALPHLQGDLHRSLIFNFTSIFVSIIKEGKYFTISCSR